MTNMERIGFGILLTLFIISGVLSVTQYIDRNTIIIPQQGGIYREAAIGQPRYINPIVATANDLDLDLTQLIYSGLFRYNKDLELENDLATSVAISDNQTQYTVTLRNDVSWHDGQPFTADDVVFTIRSIKTPDYDSPLASAFADVDIEKIDDTTVLFKLSQPYTPFLASLTVGIVPEHVWSEIEPKNATLTEQILKPVGTGPFKFSEISTRRRTGDITNFRLSRNDNYYRPAPYLDAIEFTFYPSHDEALQAVKSGTVDGIGFIPIQLLKESNLDATADIHRLLLPQYFAIFFNQQNNVALSEAGVRAALAIAIDRQQIVETALSGYAEPLHLAIPHSTIDFGEDFPEPTTNIDIAKQNLDESGWAIGEDGIREKDGNKLTVKITTTDWPEYMSTAELIKEQWSELGVDVTLEHLSTAIIQQTVVQPRNYEALLFGEILQADPDPYPFWHSTQTRAPGLNLSLFKNEDVDKLLEEARKEGDPNVRAEKYREFQNKIIEFTPAIILYRPYYLFASQGILGIDSQQAALPSGRFNSIAQWHINTERIWQ